MNLTPEPETYGGPVATPTVEHDGLGFTTQRLAAAIAESGFTIRSAQTMVRNCAAAGLIHPYGRARADKRKPFLYRADQAVALGVFHRMFESRLQRDKDGPTDPFRAMSIALLMWRADDMPPNPPSSPAAAVLAMYAQGKRGFWAETATFADPANGRVQVRARIRNEDGSGTDWGLEDHVIRSAWGTSLDSVLAHLTRAKGSVH